MLCMLVTGAIWTCDFLFHVFSTFEFYSDGAIPIKSVKFRIPPPPPGRGRIHARAGIGATFGRGIPREGGEGSDRFPGGSATGRGYVMWPSLLCPGSGVGTTPKWGTGSSNGPQVLDSLVPTNYFYWVPSVKQSQEDKKPLVWILSSKNANGSLFLTVW